MERAVAPGELTSARAVRFEVAGSGDDAEIRRLLRETPMAGRISVALEREPNWFLESMHSGTEQQTIIARDGGRIVCVGSCVVRRCFVNGVARRVGYLGGLRLDQRYGGRFDILRRGYRFFRELQREDPAEVYFTAIAADNDRARQFLEKALPGMPFYDYVGDFVTTVIPVPRRRLRRAQRTRQSDGANADLAELAECLNRCAADYQFAPAWTAQELARLEGLGLSAADFHVLRNAGPVRGCAALWDQRSFKQTVIRGYSRGLACARPWINLAARLTGRYALPAPGSVLKSAMASHLADAPGKSGALIPLIETLLGKAAERGIDYLMIGLPEADPKYERVKRRFAGRHYRSRIYTVRWRDDAPPALDDRPLRPELALL